MNKKNLIILILIIILSIGSIISVYLLIKEQKSSIKQKENGEILVQRQSCLDENERADFTIKRLGKYPSLEYDRGFIEVAVKKIDINQEILRFKIDDIINPSHYHPAEIHKCGIYVIKEFGYEPKTRRSTSNYHNDLWKYDYNGRGIEILKFSFSNSNGIYNSFYNDDFRVDFQEKYIVLEKSYLGKEDYSLIIKDLNTKEDVFVLFAKSIRKQHPNVIGNFGFDKWTDDGRYFWGDIFDGAYVNGFFRIDTQNWKVDIFEAPPDVLGGDALNVENGYITVHPGNVWYGFAEMTEEEKEKRRKEGIGTELYIHNLITGERQFITKINEPLWFFKPKWFSNIELEYELPTGEKKIYEIKPK